MVYIVDQLKQGRTCKSIAEEMNVRQLTLSGAMSFWRARGIEIPNMHYVAPEGHIRKRLQKGVYYNEKKVGNKWVQLGRADGQPYKEKQEYKKPTVLIKKKLKKLL